MDVVAENVSQADVWNALTSECGECEGYGWVPSNAWNEQKRYLNQAKEKGDIQKMSPNRPPGPAYRECGRCAGFGRLMTGAGESLFQLFVANLEAMEELESQVGTPD